MEKTVAKKQDTRRKTRLQLTGYSAVHLDIVNLLQTALQFGRGFGKANLWKMRAFYQAWPRAPALQTVSGESSGYTLKIRFPLPWSAYVRLLAVKDRHARAFYESETLRAGWSVRQLDRQINSRSYECTVLQHTRKIPKTIFTQLHSLLK